MEKKVIITAILFAMLTVVFSMSGDGENVPVVQKENVSQEASQVEQLSNFVPDQDSEAKYKETVKDELGIDTGMSKEELSEFKDEYLKLDKQMFPNAQGTMLYDFKVNLNKYEELKDAGVDLRRSGVPVEGKSYKENALYSDLILIGTTIEEDKDFGYDMYKIEIHEILKGADIFEEKVGEIPKTFHYIGEKDIAGQADPVLNIKGIYFFSNTKHVSKEKQYLHKRPESTVLLLDETKAIYEKGYKTYLDAIWYRNEIKNNKSLFEDKIKAYERWAKAGENKGGINESFEDVIKNIKRIIEINNSDNFYKETYKSEVQK